MTLNILHKKVTEDIFIIRPLVAFFSPNILIDRLHILCLSFCVWSYPFHTAQSKGWCCLEQTLQQSWFAPVWCKQAARFGYLSKAQAKLDFKLSFYTKFNLLYDNSIKFIFSQAALSENKEIFPPSTRCYLIPKQVLFLNRCHKAWHHRAANKSARVIIQMNVSTKAHLPLLLEGQFPPSQELSLLIPSLEITEVRHSACNYRLQLLAEVK